MNVSSPRLTQEERRSATRERLFEATIGVLSAKGAAGASLQTIADTAGVSKSAALHHFADKTALFVALVEDVWLRNRRMLWPLLEQIGKGPDGLLAFIQGSWRAYKAPYSIASLEILLTTRSDGVAREQVMTITSRAKEEYLGLFRAAVAAAGLPLANAEAIYALGVSIFRGLAVEYALNPRDFIEDLAQSFIALVCRPDLHMLEFDPFPPKTAPVPDPQGAPPSTRLRLIEAAITCLDREGYSLTSLSGVAALAGVAKSTALHHFKDKVTLMEAVLHHTWEHNRQGYRAAVDSAPRGREMRAFGHTAWVMYKLPRNLAEIEIHLAGRADKDLQVRIQPGGIAMTDQAERDFATVYQLAGLPAADAPTAYALGLAALRGLAIERTLLNNPTADDAAALFVAALERGLIRKDTP